MHMQVLSITSAIHSVLAVTWEQAVYRSPDRRAPFWILLWIKSAPLIFLTVSVMLFGVGLVVFVHDSGQVSDLAWTSARLRRPFRPVWLLE